MKIGHWHAFSRLRLAQRIPERFKHRPRRLNDRQAGSALRRGEALELLRNDALRGFRLASRAPQARKAGGRAERSQPRTLTLRQVERTSEEGLRGRDVCRA